MPSAARSTTSPTTARHARRTRGASWTHGAPTSTRSTPAARPALSAFLATACRRAIGLRQDDFLAVIDGMEMDVDRRHPRARSCDARSLLRPRGERRRPAVDQSVRHGRRPGLRAGASSRPRAAADQYPARPRRGRGASAGSICRANTLDAAGIATDDPRRSIAVAGIDQACRAVARHAHKHYRAADAVLARAAARASCARRG